MWPIAAAVSLLLAASNPAAPPLLRALLLCGVIMCAAQAMVEFSRRKSS